MKSFIISGKVIHGEHYGRELGFPTANLDRRSFSRRKMKIRLGVYGGYAILPFRPERSGVEKSVIKENRSLRSPSDAFGLGRDGIIYKAAIVIGPLDNHHLPKIEAHLIGFDGNLYGKRLRLSLVKYLRPFKKFNNEAELKKQIKKDIKEIKKLITYGK